MTGDGVLDEDEDLVVPKLLVSGIRMILESIHVCDGAIATIQLCQSCATCGKVDLFVVRESWWSGDAMALTTPRFRTTN